MFHWTFERAWPTAVLLVLAALGLGDRPLSAQEPSDKYDGKTAPEWVALLTSEDENVRRRACYSLGQIRPVVPETVQGLAAALKDGNIEPRWYAADALAQLGPEAKEAVPQLIAALESAANDETVRRMTAKALGNIGPAAAEATPALDKATAGDDAPLRIAAALALYKITGQIGKIRPVLEAIKGTDAAAAYAGLLALREVGPAGLPGAKSVVACLGHADRDVRRAAVKVLAGWKLEALPALVEALGLNDEPTVLGATTALALVLDEARRTIVENPQADAAAREEALRAMLSQALPALAARMTDPRAPIAASARRAVAVIGLPAAAHLVTMLASADAAQRNAAAAALRELEDYLPPPGKLPSHLAAVRTALVPQLITALKSSERTTRIAALRLFATLEIGPEGAAALPQLQAALKDEDVAVRSDAAQALDRVQKAEKP